FHAPPPRSWVSRFRLLPCVVRWWQSDVAREGNAEAARGAVADLLRDLGDGGVLVPQEVFRQGHAPAEQVLHWSNPHGATETLEERRTGQCGLVRQLRDRPRLGRALVHPSYRDSKPLVAEPAHKARRRCGARRGTEDFDEQNLKQAGEDDLARGPPFARLFSHERHARRQ